MSLLAKLEKALSAEDLNTVKEALGEDFDYDVIPRSRLNKVIKERNSLRESLELAESASSTEQPPAGDDVKTPGGEETFTQAQLEEKINELKKSMKIDQLVREELLKAKCVDVELATGLLDKSSFTEEGKGIAEVLKSLTESKPFLFEVAPSGTGKGGTPPGGKEETALDKSLDAIFAPYSKDSGKDD